jgi:hypothetical protein
MYRLKTGVYASNRFGLAMGDHTRWGIFNFLLIKSLKCYLRGFALFCRSLLPWQSASQKT